jgi:hypothetical protein
MRISFFNLMIKVMLFVWSAGRIQVGPGGQQPLNFEKKYFLIIFLDKLSLVRILLCTTNHMNILILRGMRSVHQISAFESVIPLYINH